MKEEKFYGCMILLLITSILFWSGLLFKPYDVGLSLFSRVPDRVDALEKKVVELEKEQLYLRQLMQQFRQFEIKDNE